ncbi:MAG: hypothetical protein B1H40_01545 [Candidatus Latescibacteria bacterium 4484_181]|nr:MAG: hypothetical protein B1H40_01545 [Candidatus Latescibacteria bacterium 4484_181]RKY68179.1 MAG: hypothetical protein DRQ02_05020 [Candidatus Latescibacterota bacterium]RKY71760.1 MAG: hypothetical protein DRQ24_06620 [Candidatus Latescibacterota bacterium]
MPRPKKWRWVGFSPPVTYFRPQGISPGFLSHVVLTVDELEALRLADLEGMSQEEAGQRMKVSRPTFGRIVAQAHKKVADALVNGKAIQIRSGEVIMPPFGPPFGRGPHRWGKWPPS